MFTGIVEGLGRIAGVEERDDGRRLRIRVPEAFTGLAEGASLAVNGVCLTVVSVVVSMETLDDAIEVQTDLAAETLRRTTFGHLRPGDAVNLERPVPAAGRLDGHLVAGHVDGVGRVVRVRPEGEGVWLEVEAPRALERFIAEKGSVALDGVSLTVAAVSGSTFAVALIPYTLRATTLGGLREGDQVNIEVDVLARYLDRLLETAAVRTRLEDPAGREGSM